MNLNRKKAEPPDDTTLQEGGNSLKGGVRHQKQAPKPALELRRLDQYEDAINAQCCSRLDFFGVSSRNKK
jgi:hypothetical protein